MTRLTATADGFVDDQLMVLISNPLMVVNDHLAIVGDQLTVVNDQLLIVDDEPMVVDDPLTIVDDQLMVVDNTQTCTKVLHGRCGSSRTRLEGGASVQRWEGPNRGTDTE